MSTIANYYIKTKSNTIQFCSLSTYLPPNGVPSDIKPSLELQFKMNDTFLLMKDNSEIGEIREFFPLIGTKCSINFKTRGTNKNFKLILNPVTDRWYLGGYYVFNKNIELTDIEWLSAWKDKNTIMIYWDIQGYAFVNENFNGELHNVIQYSINNNSQGHELGLDEFEKKILISIKMHDKYVREFFTNDSEIFTSPALSKGIKELIHMLEEFQITLAGALGALRISQTPDEFRGNIAMIRTTLDTIKNHKNDISFWKLSKNLYVDNGHIKDITGKPKGAEKAANELLLDVWKQFDSIFDIASKAIHTRNRPTSQIGNFIMSPDYFDTEFLLTGCLNITNYLIKRIKSGVIPKK